MTDNNLPVYDEDQAIDFIRKALPSEVSDKYTDDDLYFIIDSIWDHYEAAGMTSLDDIETDNETVDIRALTDYVRKAVKKDGHILMTDQDLNMIVKAELQYEQTLEDFSD